jgi:hypothetical protein
MFKRGLKSPDRADALAMTLYLPAEETPVNEHHTDFAVMEDFEINIR